MERTIKFIFGICIGFIIGVIGQGIYDARTLIPKRDVELLGKDTIFISDTIPSDTMWLVRYKPIPTKTYTTHDTIYIENKPIVALKTHKVYDSSIDTLKCLGDSLKYAQRIDYHITTMNDEIDTIQIATQEEIPVITHYVEYKAKKPKLILSAGVGLGLSAKGKITPTLGITLGYPLWQLK